MENTKNVELGKYYQMGPRSFLLIALKGAGPMLSLFLIALFLLIANNYVPADVASNPAFSAISGIAPFALFALGLVSFAIGIVLARIEYNVCRFMMDESSFHLVSGILNKEEISLPYKRIQSVKIKQTLFQRIFNVARVLISTTTDLDVPSHDKNDESDDEVIELIDYPLATMLERTLMDHAEVERMEIGQRANRTL